MKCEWKQCTIGDICDTISETYHGTQNEVILVNTSAVLDGKILNHTPIENKNLKGQFKKTFQCYDILYSEIRPANKRFAFVDFENTNNYIASTKLMVLRCKQEKVIPRFMFLYLSSQSVINELQHLAETRSGTFPQITFNSELAPMIINLPNKNIQEKIISIIDSINKKIELNNKINENLEQQAQAIFKSWFVDFEPFDGEMPDDWKKSTLASVANITSGKRPPIKQAEKTEDIFIPLVGAASVMGYTNKVLYDEKILVTGRVGTHGIVQRFNSPCWTSDNTLVIISNLYEYVYQILQRLDYQNMNRGSTQPLITQTDLKNVEIILPSTDILSKFECLVGYLMNQVEANIIENNKLTELRDALLPKLMSGELDVSNIDI